MGLFTAVAKQGGKIAAPRIGKIAPEFTGSFLDRVLDQAIRGIGPFEPAREVADEARREHPEPARAARALIASHARLAAAQGFLTNIGGLVTLAVSIPANVTGLTMVQLRLHAALAHLYGHDLDAPGVRAAILVTLLGHDDAAELVDDGDLPGDARWFLTHGAPDHRTRGMVAAVVATRLVALLGGKQVATFVGKRVPLVGGVGGAFGDGRVTQKLGRDAAHDLAPVTTVKATQV